MNAGGGTKDQTWAGAAGLGLTALALAASPWLAGGPLACPFHWLTGLPCPLCGLTHAWAALAQGDLAGAVAHHPLGPALALAALAWSGWQLWLGLSARPTPRWAALAGRVCGCLLTLALAEVTAWRWLT